MTKEQIKIRDLIAMPFWMIAYCFDWLAVSIGGTWTAELYIDNGRYAGKNK